MVSRVRVSERTVIKKKGTRERTFRNTCTNKNLKKSIKEILVVFVLVGGNIEV